MACLAPTIKDKEFKNWLRGALAVLFAKQGLDDFVNGEITQFQKDLLALIFINKSIPAGTVCNTCTTENVLPCPTQNFCPKGHRCKLHDIGKPDKHPNLPCPVSICHDIRDAIRREHRFNGPSWKNTNATQWCTDAFEIAKCFMAPDGYSSVTSLVDTDFNGTLAVIINNKRFQNKMAARLNQQNNICTEARDVGRSIRHSSDLALSDSALATCIDTLLDLLLDPKHLAVDPKAQEAVNKLKQLNSYTLTISTEDITTILDHSLTEMIAKQREVSLQTITTATGEATKEIDESTKTYIKLLGEMKAAIGNMQTVKASSLDQIITVKLSVLDEIKRAAEKEKQEIAALGTKERQLIQGESPKEKAGFFRRLSGVFWPRKDAAIERKQQESDLRNDLITFYRSEYTTIPIAPLVGEIDVPLIEFYVQPPLTAVDIKTLVQYPVPSITVPIHSYRDLLSRSDGGFYQNVYITAKAGIGKTSFAKKVCLTWCQAHTPLKPWMQKFEPTDVDAMKQFDFLFLVLLRDVGTSYCQLDSMIYEQVISGFSGCHEYSDNFLKGTLHERKCLIVLDGLDEWTHPNGCKRGSHTVHDIPHRPLREHCTVITTTRPWKLDAAKLNSNQIDRHVEINELNKDTSSQLVSNAVTLLNARSHKNRIKSEEDFLRTVSSLRLDAMRYIPYILLQIICLWFDGKSIGNSKCQVYSNILELALSRCLTRVGMKDRSFRKKSHMATPLSLPSCFHLNELCTEHFVSLLNLGKLAFETLLSLKREATLVFDKNTVLSYISEDSLQFYLKTGLLSQTKDYQHVSCRQSNISFQHKSIQEYFAALYINSDSESEYIRQRICSVCDTLSAVIDLSNVFVFLGGLNPEVCGKILHLIDKNDTGNVKVKYRNTSMSYLGPEKYRRYFETMKSFQNLLTDIVQEIINNGQNEYPLYLEDIIITYKHAKSYSLLKPLLENNKSNIKSLHIKALRSSTDFTRTTETFDLPNVQSVHKLEICGVPRKKDLHRLLSGSAQTLSCLVLEFAVIQNQKYVPKYTAVLPETIILILSMDQLLSLCLIGVPLTHSDLLHLLSELTKRTNMTEIALDNIKCTDHDDSNDGMCNGHKLDLSQHQKLRMLDLHNIGVSNLGVYASLLECCIIGHLPNDSYSSLSKCLQDAKCLQMLWIQDSNDFLKKTCPMLPKLVHLSDFAIFNIDIVDSAITLSREMTNIKKIGFINVKMTSTTLGNFIASIEDLPPVTTELIRCTVTPEKEYKQLKEKMRSSPKYRILFSGLNNLKQDVFRFQTICHTQTSP